MGVRVLVVPILTGVSVCSVWLWMQGRNERRTLAGYASAGTTLLRAAQRAGVLLLEQVEAVTAWRSRTVAQARAPLPVPVRQEAPARVAVSRLAPAPQRQELAAPRTPRSTSLRIETLAQFRLLHHFSNGVIVITNRSGRARAHETECSSLTAANFTKKVITNEGKGGAYYYFAHFEDAVRELGARRCKTCAQAASTSAEVA
jgi:hypothetical protein